MRATGDNFPASSSRLVRARFICGFVFPAPNICSVFIKQTRQTGLCILLDLLKSHYFPLKRKRKHSSSRELGVAVAEQNVRYRLVYDTQ